MIILSDVLDSIDLIKKLNRIEYNLINYSFEKLLSKVEVFSIEEHLIVL